MTSTRTLYSNIDFCVYDNIIKNNSKYLDYNGNIINPNSSYNSERGTEKYASSYIWYGNGLKKIDKYGENYDLKFN